MGNSSSSGRGHHEETVDYGYLSPQGVYTTPKDYNQTIVSQLICARKLAPFYRPLEEYEDSWDDEQILAARKEFPDSEGTTDSSTTRTEPASKTTQSKRSSLTKDHIRPEASVYKGAVECPICFLYYPPNINYSRCCDQAICTECFVQIKRAEPTTTHLVSEPAACPYCVQDNFGVVYTPPIWRAGIGSEAPSPWSDSLKVDPPHPTHKRRQKSYSPESPEVVTTDQIRPDWEAKLAAVRAAVTRRANRRIIMRQVGDRLIPVGVTSGRVHAITPEEGQNDGADNSGSRRSRRRHHHNQEFNQMLGLAGQDLEDLMVMEAMRLSLLDHEEHLRREAQNRNNNHNNGNEGGPIGSETTSSSFLTVPGASIVSYSDGPSPSSSIPVSSTVSASSSLSSDETRSHQEPISAPSAVASSSQPFGAIDRLAMLQAMSDTTPSWRRTSNPPPFATLTAAMGAAATASAILGSRELTSTPGALLDNTSQLNTETNCAAPIIAVTGSTAESNAENDDLTSLESSSLGTTIAPPPTHVTDLADVPDPTIQQLPGDTVDPATAATTTPHLSVDQSN